MDAPNNKAVKFDTGKAPLGLVPRSGIEGVARVMAFGAQKYGKHNWRNGMDWSRLIDAGLRHVEAFNDGEDFDPETGELHLFHALCCFMFVAEYYDKGLGTDDRYTNNNNNKDNKNV